MDILNVNKLMSNIINGKTHATVKICSSGKVCARFILIRPTGHIKVVKVRTNGINVNFLYCNFYILILM